MRHVRVAPNRPGRGAGRVEQHGVDRMVRAPGQRIGGDRRHRKTEPVQIGYQPVEAAGRAVDRRDMGAGVDELRGLAAGRRAQIYDALPGDAVEQPRRQ